MLKSVHSVLCLFLLVGAMCGCGAGTDSDTSDEGGEGTPDVLGSEGGDAEQSDTETVDVQSPPSDATEDSGTPPSDTVEEKSACEVQCESLGACEALPTEHCVTRCESAPGDLCDGLCFEAPESCESLAGCLDVHAPVATFSTDPPAYEIRGTVGHFTLQTLDGPWTFSDHYDGNDSYHFLNYAEGYDYPDQLWNSTIKWWLIAMPKNSHVFFMSFDTDAEAKVTEMRDKVEAALEKKSFTDADRCHWRRRIHYVTDQGGSISTGYIGEFVNQKGLFSFGIDRFQKLRQHGMLQFAGGTPDLAKLQYEAEYFNFEWEREQELTAQGEVEVVPVFDKEWMGTTEFEVTFPSKEEMAQYDRLQVDFTANCDLHEDANCGEWDYLSSLYICDRGPEENANAETACQFAVAGQEAVEEVIGACATSGDPCTSDTNCGEGEACDGGVVGQNAIEAVPADILSCECTTPHGEALESTQTCNGDGSGFGDCVCGCPTEVMRWITTYSREGRWVTDMSPMLAHFREGGAFRLRYTAGYSYFITLNFRLFSEGDTDRPYDMVSLYGGGSFNASYNNKYQPMEVEIPADATRVELMGFITGHGFGKDTENCAEFCNHTHHFYIDPDPVSCDGYTSAVAGVEAVVEVMGACSGSTDACMTAETCPEGESCDGYIAPVEGADAAEEVLGVCSSTGAECTHLGHCTASENIKEHTDPDTTNIGCANKVPQGVVPNQYGTWHYSRAGWCPGFDVEPWVVDVTDQVVPGTPATVYYRGMFRGEEYVPIPAEGNGFGANIIMTSWLVFYH